MNHLLLGIFLFMMASHARADVNASARHVVILQPSVDMLWGSYLFAAENRSPQPASARLSMMLPLETGDFRPEEGLEPQDIILGDGGKGHLQIQKDFKPGSTLIGLSFNVITSSGTASMHFDVPYELGEFVIMAPVGALELQSKDMTLAKNQPFMGKRYDMLRATDLKKGGILSVSVDGIPEGRQRYWYVGGFAGILLCVAGLGMAWMTRPKEHEKEL